MATKLSRIKRENIIDVVINKAMIEQRAAYKTAKAAFADQVYNNMLTDYQVFIAQLPKGFFHKDTAIKVTSVHLQNKQYYSYYQCEMTKERPLPYSWLREGVGIDHDEQLSAMAKQLAALKKQLIAFHDEIKSKVTAIVWSVSTVEKLIEIWPEGKEFFPESEPPKNALVPINQVADLNKILFPEKQ